MFCTSRILSQRHHCLKHISVYQKIQHTNMSTKQFKVFVTRNDFPEESLRALQQRTDVEVFNGTNITKEQIIQGIKGKNAIYCSLNDKIDKEVINAAGETLKVVSTMSVGVDHIDWRYCKERGVKVGYTPEVLTEAVAELCMALLLATSRRLFEAYNEAVNGGWSSWSPMWMCGHGLHESTVGIVGFGNIGSEIARKLKAFRVSRILYTSPSEKPADVIYRALRTDPSLPSNPLPSYILLICEFYIQTGIRGGRLSEDAKEVCAEKVCLEELLKESDFVIVSCALTKDTTGLFDKEKFALMKPTSIFINISRGGTVVQEDLQDALERKIIGAAGLDVMTPEPLPTDHCLLSLPNCVILPHIGSATYKSRNEMGELTTNNILAALDGQPLPKEWK